MVVPQIIENGITICLAFPPLCIYLKELKAGSQRAIYTPMLIEAFLTIAKGKGLLGNEIKYFFVFMKMAKKNYERDNHWLEMEETGGGSGGWRVEEKDPET